MVKGTPEVDDGWMRLLPSCGSMASRGWVVGRFDVKDAKLCDDVVWISSDRELDCAGRRGFTPFESIKKRLGLRDNYLSGQLGSVLYSI